MLVPKVDQRPERTLDVLKGDPRELRTEFLRLPHSESAALAFLEKIGLWGAEWDSEVALKYYSTQALNCESGDLLCGDFGYRYFSGRPVPISIEELWAEQEHWRELLLDPAQLRAKFPIAPSESAPPSHKLWFATQTHFGNTLPVHLEWKKGDSFVIPLWQWHSHENLGGDEAILFSINDRPVMEGLQLYREEVEN